MDVEQELGFAREEAIERIRDVAEMGEELGFLKLAKTVLQSIKSEAENALVHLENSPLPRTPPKQRPPE